MVSLVSIILLFCQQIFQLTEDLISLFCKDIQDSTSAVYVSYERQKETEYLYLTEVPLEEVISDLRPDISIDGRAVYFIGRSRFFRSGHLNSMPEIDDVTTWRIAFTHKMFNPYLTIKKDITKPITDIQSIVHSFNFTDISKKWLKKQVFRNSMDVDTGAYWSYGLSSLPLNDNGFNVARNNRRNFGSQTLCEADLLIDEKGNANISDIKFYLKDSAFTNRSLLLYKRICTSGFVPASHRGSPVKVTCKLAIERDSYGTYFRFPVVMDHTNNQVFNIEGGRILMAQMIEKHGLKDWLSGQPVIGCLFANRWMLISFSDDKYTAYYGHITSSECHKRIIKNTDIEGLDLLFALPDKDVVGKSSFISFRSYCQYMIKYSANHDICWESMDPSDAFIPIYRIWFPKFYGDSPCP